MKTLRIYDPAMCCVTGVCGPDVDPKLVKLTADIAFLKSHGIEVTRYNLGHQPEAFTSNPQILGAMGAEGENLPIFMVDDDIRAVGDYPNRQELASWFGIEAGVMEDKPRQELKVVSEKRCC